MKAGSKRLGVALTWMGVGADGEEKKAEAAGAHEFTASAVDGSESGMGFGFCA
jgi:hypothetical protein